jgi:hypothetical protein
VTPRRGVTPCAVANTSQANPMTKSATQFTFQATARFNLWADSPLLRPPRQRRRNLGSQYHSIMKRVRSRRPTSRRARASSLGTLDAESLFRIVEGATMRSFVDAAIRSNSSQLSQMRSMLILGPRWAFRAG